MRICLLVAALGLSAASTAGAAPAADLQLFHPSLGTSGLLNVESGYAVGHGTLRVGLWGSGARGILRTDVEGSGVPLGDVVTQRYDLSLVMAVALWRRIELGLELPGVVFQEGLNTKVIRTLIGKEALRARGLGDVRLAGKAMLLSSPGQPSLALVLDAALPSGDADDFFGEPGVVLAPALALSRRFERGELTCDLGYRHRGRATQILGAEVGSEIFYRLVYALDVRVRGAPTLSHVLLGFYGHTPAGAPFGLRERDRAGFANALELTAALARRVLTEAGEVRVMGGLGTSLLPGYGAPLVSAVLGVDFITRQAFDDSDGDGIANVYDECAELAEDDDEWQQSDGCPDLDNDGDGIADVDDECPDEPEDIDGFEDYDGCRDIVDEDEDQDGVKDPEDECPGLREDLDGFEDTDGCPDEDNDGDGLADLSDMCPNDFEDQRTSEDKDGCSKSRDEPSLVRYKQGRVSFAREVGFDGPRLSSEGSRMVGQLARLLRSLEDVELVELTVAPAGATPAMRRLAERRAATIAAELSARGVKTALKAAAGTRPARGNLVSVKLVRASGEKPERGGRPR